MATDNAVDPRGLAAVREYFEQFWQTSLGSFREAAEGNEQPNEEET